MTEIKITVKNKIATCLARNPIIICGNSDYEVHFTFDAEWDAYNEKTARFIYGGKFTDVKFSGDVCPVPIIVGAEQCKIGVYAGNLSTTTPAIIDCQKSILDIAATESEGGVETTPNSFEVYVENVREYAEQAEKASIRYIRYIANDARLTPSNVSVVPSSFVHGNDYKGTFTVEGTTMYLNDDNIDNNTGDNTENLFFAVRKSVSHEVGFIIDLGAEKDISLTQLYLWGVYQGVELKAMTSSDNKSWVEADVVNVPSIFDGELSVYRFQVNGKARYIKILQTEGWTDHRFIVKGVEVFRPTLDGQYVIAQNSGVKDYLDTYNTDTLHNTANALKGAKSGDVVRVDDVSPIEHKAKVKVRGKNLLPFPYYKSSSANAGGTFTVLEDGGISGSGTPTGYCDMYVYQGKPLADSGIVTLSMSGTYTNMVATVAIYDDAENQLITKNWEANPVKLNLDELTSAAKWLILIKRKTDNIEMSGAAYLQVEYGDTATEYESYIDPSSVTVTRYGAEETDNPVSYTPDTNGNCEITSLSPTMTLLTDTAGVTIDLEYNKDINAENEAVRADITALDNTVAEHTVLLGDVETALDNIIAIQTGLIGG